MGKLIGILGISHQTKANVHPHPLHPWHCADSPFMRKYAGYVSGLSHSPTMHGAGQVLLRMTHFTSKYITRSSHIQPPRAPSRAAALTCSSTRNI